MTKPSNPFTLPELAENETVFPPSILKSACTLAAHYIAAREIGDVNAAERFDSDIGALLSEEFAPNQCNEKEEFRARFMKMIQECNEAFGLLEHHHSQWASTTQV